VITPATAEPLLVLSPTAINNTTANYKIPKRFPFGIWNLNLWNF
jgi:hypothetical protein